MTRIARTTAAGGVVVALVAGASVWAAVVDVAPSTGDVVKVSGLDEPYYAQRYAGARRVAG